MEVRAVTQKKGGKNCKVLATKSILINYHSPIPLPYHKAGREIIPEQKRI